MNRSSSTYSPTISDPALIGVEISMDFTGKEKDFESGYHYFGARYYDSEVLTGWLSVDPMSDKYPHVSPYNYCEWNPVILKDEDGEGPVLSLAGALVGATVNTALAVYEGKRGTELLAAAAGGAVSGAVYSSNPWTQAAAGAAGEFVEQAINKACGNREEFDGITIVVAGAAGGVGGKAKLKAKDATEHAAEKAAQKAAPQIRKDVKREVKQSGQPNGHNTKTRINSEAVRRTKNYQQQKHSELKQGGNAVTTATTRGASNASSSLTKKK